MPSPTPLPREAGELKVPLQMQVGPDGHVTEIKALGSSGDEAFDQKLLKYGKKFRFIPALSEDGTPIASTFAFVYKATSMQGSPRAMSTGEFPGSTATRAAPSRNDLYDEVGRVTRMRCKDFLWEYDLLKDIAGSRPVNDELMLRTTQAMYLVHSKTSGDAVKDVGLKFSRALREAVSQCRKIPEEKFFIGVFAPAFDNILGRGTANPGAT